MTAPNAASVDRVVRQLRTAEAKCSQSLSGLGETLSGLEQLQGEIETALEAVRGAGADLQAAVAAEGNAVADTLQTLAEAARAGEEQRVPGCAAAGRDAATACGQAADEAAARIAKAEASLQEGGLSSLREALTASGERDESSSAVVEGALSELRQACDAVGAEIRSAGDEAALRLGEVSGRLGGELAEGLVTASEAAIGDLDTEAGAARDAASRVESEVVAAYEEWTADVEAACDAHGEVVAATAEEVAGRVEEALTGVLEAACEALEAGPLRSAQESLAGVLGSAEGWSEGSAEVAAVAGELEEGYAAMARLDRAARGEG